MSNNKMVRNYYTVRISFICIIVSLIYFCHSAYAETGKIIKCLNGDSYIVLNGFDRLNIKLWGVECPQDGQPWNEQAMKYVESKILNKKIEYHVKIQTSKNELYSIVTLADGTCLNTEVLKMGFGWWNSSQEKINPVYSKAEFSARTQLKEIWSDNSSIPPWKWREYISLINYKDG